MSDEIMRINRRFLDLYDEIIAEINAVSLNLENLSDELITDEDYYSTSLRLEHIHNLFDKVSDVLKELPLTQDNPDLYSLLEKKKLLNRLFGELSGLEHTLSREYKRAKGSVMSLLNRTGYATFECESSEYELINCNTNEDYNKIFNKKESILW